MTMQSDAYYDQLLEGWDGPEEVVSITRTELIAQSELKKRFEYNQDTGVFTRLFSTTVFEYGSVAGGKNSDGYIVITIFGTSYRAHRLAWLYVYGSWPESKIDHINHIRDDNRIVNLREATVKQNNENTLLRSDNKSGKKGVSWDKTNRQWKAAIGHNRKMLTIGYFKSIELASDAYRAMALKIHSHNFGV